MKDTLRDSLSSLETSSVFPYAYRAQVDALEIEALAKIRLADEYDAAQKRGEVATDGRPKTLADDKSIATAADLGLRHDEIYNSRQPTVSVQVAPKPPAVPPARAGGQPLRNGARAPFALVQIRRQRRICRRPHPYRPLVAGLPRRSC